MRLITQQAGGALKIEFNAGRGVERLDLSPREKAALNTLEARSLPGEGHMGLTLRATNLASGKFILIEARFKDTLRQFGKGIQFKVPSRLSREDATNFIRSRWFLLVAGTNLFALLKGSHIVDKYGTYFYKDPTGMSKNRVDLPSTHFLPSIPIEGGGLLNVPNLATTILKAIEREQV